MTVSIFLVVRPFQPCKHLHEKGLPNGILPSMPIISPSIMLPGSEVNSNKVEFLGKLRVGEFLRGALDLRGR